MRRALFISAAMVFVAVTTLFAGWWQVDGPGAQAADTIDDARPVPLTDMTFSMIDQDGRAVGPETLLGRPALVFFGFTYCPEICPTTLSDISDWLDGLGQDAEEITPVLITVDPERDSADVLAEYLEFFHEDIQGWTGAPDALAEAAEGFRARYERVPTTDGDYTMDHTAGVFLFDGTGRFVTAIDYHEPREFALPKIRRAMGQ